MSELARVLPWDSEHFGTRIARLGRPSLDAASARALVAWMRSEEVACVYCLFDANDAASARAIQDVGGRFVDDRLTYSRALRAGDEARVDGARLATASDIESLEVVAESAHTDSRFYFDGAFDRRRADLLYRIWIQKSVNGSFASGAVTLDHEGSAAGYVTFSGPDREGAGRGEIGLVAVAERARGRGAGGTLLRAALAELRTRGAERVDVVTQGRNAAAQRLYQRAGFVTERVETWFHLWARSA